LPQDQVSLARHVTGSILLQLRSKSGQNNIVPATIHADLCYPKQGNPAGLDNMYWLNPFFEPDNMSLLNQDGTPDFDLTRINGSLMGTYPSPDIPEPRTTVEDHVNNDRLVTSPESAIRQLANINVALYECATKLPSMPEAGVDSVGIGTSKVRRSQKETEFVIDEIFRLTAEFIDVIKSLSGVECDTNTPSSSSSVGPSSTPRTFSLFINRLKLSHTDQAAAQTRKERLSLSFSHVDEATMLMVMSCHSLLTETYLSIFYMMQACIQYSVVPQMDKGWVVVLPRIQVGSHASPPIQVDANSSLSPGTTAMYMLMVAILSSQLCAQLVDVMGAGRWDRSSGRGGEDIHPLHQPPGTVDKDPIDPVSGSKCTIADTMWDTAIERTNRLWQTIQDTKKLLHQYSLVIH
jgi:hypothetical protein